MKAWHVQDKFGENQEIVFAEKRSDAIQKSEAIGWVDYIDVRAKRAKYADGLYGDSVELKKAQLANGWWFECHGVTCHKQLTIDDSRVFIENAIYCKECSTKNLVNV